MVQFQAARRRNGEEAGVCLITLMDLIASIGPGGTAGLPLNNEEGEAG